MNTSRYRSRLTGLGLSQNGASAVITELNHYQFEPAEDKQAHSATYRNEFLVHIKKGSRPGRWQESLSGLFYIRFRTSGGIASRYKP